MQYLSIPNSTCSVRYRMEFVICEYQICYYENRNVEQNLLGNVSLLLSNLHFVGDICTITSSLINENSHGMQFCKADTINVGI